MKSSCPIYKIRIDDVQGRNVAAGRIDFFISESTCDFDAHFCSVPRSELVFTGSYQPGNGLKRA